MKRELVNEVGKQKRETSGVINPNSMGARSVRSNRSKQKKKQKKSQNQTFERVDFIAFALLGVAARSTHNPVPTDGSYVHAVVLYERTHARWGRRCWRPFWSRNVANGRPR